jgi:FMN-dependent NADH-azoreductase
MRTLLHISASPRGGASYSRRFGQDLVAGLQADEALRVVERDLGAEPLPYPDAAFMAASLMAESERGVAEMEALALSERLIGELDAADVVVIDTPMHNFTVPAALKAWIDNVVRPLRTFGFSPQGKIGLLRDRPVYVIVACGGGFDETAGGQTDFLTPYLRYVLAIVGLRDVSTLRLERLRRGPAAVEQAEAQAANWIMEKVASWQRGQHRQC